MTAEESGHRRECERTPVVVSREQGTPLTVAVKVNFEAKATAKSKRRRGLPVLTGRQSKAFNRRRHAVF